MKTNAFIRCILLLLVAISFCSLNSYAINYVCIDPGHGGSDSGTVGRVYHVPEKRANLKVGLVFSDFNFTDDFISNQMDSHYPKSENKHFILYKFCVLQAMGCSEEGKKVTEFKHKPSNREES